MRIRTVLTSFFLCLLTGLAGPRVQAQLMTPGDAGVVMGHIHLVAHDLDGMRQFFMKLGGVSVQNGQLALIQFPGAFILVRQADPTGGTVGSVVNHFGFNVKNLQESLVKWRAAGVTTESGGTDKQIYLVGPEGVRVEVIEDAAIATPIKFHHIHFFVTDPLEVQAWYAKTFGARPGKRGNFDAADLPGVNLTYTKADAALVTTKGRALDHIGFEIKNLEQFCKKIEAAGIKFDRPYQHLPNSATAIAFITDPWGTYIELTENLSPPAQ